MPGFAPYSAGMLHKTFKYITALSVSGLIIGFMGPTTSAKDETWNCPNETYTRNAMRTGEVEKWPHYTSGPAMRVQKQHPNTAITAQAKYVDKNGSGGAICQYYNHIGLIFTILVLDVRKDSLETAGYWREEYTESYPEQDDPNDLMIDVCVEDRKGIAYPSVQCAFLVSFD